MKLGNPSQKQIVDELWRRGNLTFKLDSNQKALIDNVHKSNEKITTWLLSRRMGKTYTLITLAIETCLKDPNRIVKFVAPTKLQARTIIRPIINSILEDCPQELKPKEKKNEYIFSFYNGSEIQIAGSDGGHAEKLRGTDSHLVIIDEAGSCSDLNNLIMSILMPTTLMTKGKIILASTPPKDSDHEFLSYIERCQISNTLTVKNIYDNPRLTRKEIDEEIEKYGGITSEFVRREYLCELIKSSETSVIPEFTEALQKDIVKENTKPPFFDSYVSMDVGGKDLTVLLFSYYDFKEDTIVIEDEIVMDFQKSGNNLEKLSQQVDDKEKELWEDKLTFEIKRPYLRLSDIDHIVINEIYKYSRGLINFIASRREVKDVGINSLRTLLISKKLIIHPRCKTLIRHLSNVKWYSATNKTKFARSPDNGHYDAVDALLILIRNVQFNKNPYPIGYNYNKKDLYIKNYNSYNTNGNSSAAEFLKKLYKIKT